MYLFLNLELWFKKIFLDNRDIGKLVVINNVGLVSHNFRMDAINCSLT